LLSLPVVLLIWVMTIDEAARREKVRELSIGR
jgi:hypothetical protein